MAREQLPVQLSALRFRFWKLKTSFRSSSHAMKPAVSVLRIWEDSAACIGGFVARGFRCGPCGGLRVERSVPSRVSAARLFRTGR